VLRSSSVGGRGSDGRQGLIAEKKEDLRVIARRVTRAEWAAVQIEMCWCVGEGW
jgi:hypothetical protein